MRARRLTILPLALALLLLPIAANADSHEKAPKPLTWISYVQSQTGKAQALAMSIGTNGAKIYDGLMADGHILGWGVAMPVNHRADDSWNVMEYVTFRDWAGVDAFMEAFMADMMSKTPEQTMAEQKEWYSLIEAGSHWDAIYRHQLFETSSMVPPAYFNLGFYDAKPGQEDALTGQFKKYVAPVMAKVMEAGKIDSWGVAVPEVHGSGGGSHVVWWGMPNLAAREAVVAAWGAAAKERGEEAQKAMMEEFAAAADLGSHHDRIMMVVYKGGSAAGAKGEGGEGSE